MEREYSDKRVKSATLVQCTMRYTVSRGLITRIIYQHNSLYNIINIYIYKHIVGQRDYKRAC